MKLNFKNKNKKTETVVFDNGSDLLIAMIRGRRFNYKGTLYCFDKEISDFKQVCLLSVSDVSVNIMCSALVGNELIELEPVYIPVNTTLLVTNNNPQNHKCIYYTKRHFSHWNKEKVNTFTNGATSDTQNETEEWDFWTFASKPDVKFKDGKYFK